MDPSLPADILSLKCFPELQACLSDLKGATPTIASRLTVVLGELFEEITSSRNNSTVPQDQAPQQPEPVVIDSLTKLTGISMLQPRGKFDIHFASDGMFFANTRSTVHVPYSQIPRVFILDGMPGERRNKICMLVDINPGCTVMHGKKALSCIAIDLKEGMTLTAPHPKLSKDGSKKSEIQGEAAVVLCTLFGIMKIVKFESPNKKIFTSSAGLSCISANFKTSQGYLYPFQRTLVYVGSPCRISNHKDILGVEMQGAGSGLRTFNIVLYDKEGDIIAEYSQLEAADLECWRRYMAETGLKQVTGQMENTDDEAEDTNQGQDDDDESEDDEDFDPDAEEKAAGSSRKRARPDSMGEAGPSNAGDGDSESEESEEDEGDDHEYEDDTDGSNMELEDENGCSVAQLEEAITKQSKQK